MSLADAKAVIKEQLKKWQELQRLANDASLAPFFTALASSNGKAAAAGAQRGLEPQEPTERNGLLQAVAKACIAYPNDFTIKEVLRDMSAAGFQFKGDPRANVGNALRTLKDRQVIFLVKESAGRRPATYTSRSEEFETDTGG